MVELIKVATKIPSQYLPLFPHETFNEMQSYLVDQVLSDDGSLVVAAPTGSGKTVVHELAIIRLIQNTTHNRIKAVYIAPNKALCQQKRTEWQKFDDFGFMVLEITGDTDVRHCMSMITDASIIITTPEKWDSLTRSWRDNLNLLGSIDLLLLDEIHHLGEDRGSTLETVVVRMRMVRDVYIERINRTNNVSILKMRIVALSATMPNLDDIGDWLECGENGVHFFDDTFRPVPLEVKVESYGQARNPFLFEKILDGRVRSVISRYSEGKQTLIFCASKKGAENLCDILLRETYSASRNANTQEVNNLINSLQDIHLKALVQRGYGYHHGGLPPDDRVIVESLFLGGYIDVLCSTSTLAHGVNLPAHLVIIKGTNSWRGGSRGYERTSRSDVIQMIGRAGRPDFDSTGIAVIMTSDQDKFYYQNLSTSADVVESTMQHILVEAICCEITQGVISCLADCGKWLRSTFFYIRVRKNPSNYGFAFDINNEIEVQKALEGICCKSLEDLQSCRIIDYYPETGRIDPCREAFIMTKQIIKLKTMTQLMALPTCLPLQKVIESISHSEELNKPVRRSEKQILNAMLKSCTFPIKTRVQDPWHKSYTLLITAVDRVPIADFSLRVEQSEVVERTIRILSALIDLAKFRLTGPILVNAILIEKALRTRLWSLIERAVEEADQPIKSAFLLQCGGLLDKTIENIKTIDAVNLNNFNSIVHGIPIQQVIPLQDGAIIQTFMNGFKITQLTFAFMVIEEGLIVTIDHVFPSTTPAQLPFIPIYNLICYDVRTNTTLLHRKFEYTQATPIQFQCKVPQGTTRHNIKVNFLSSIAGQDLYYSPNREIQLDDDRNRKKTRIRRKQTPKPNQNTASNINFDDFTCVDTIPPDTNEETNQHFEKLMDDEIKDVDAPKSTRVPYQSTMDEYYYQELVNNQNNNTKPISTTVVEACSQAQSIVDTAHRSEASELISRKRCNDVTIKIPVRAEAARLLNKARSPPMPDNVLQTLHEKAKELKLAQVNVRRIQPKKYTSIGRGNRLHDESDSLQPDFKIGKVDRSHEAIDLARKRKYEDELRMPNNQPSYGALERNGVVYRKQESNDRISTLEEDPYGKVNQLHTFHPAENFQQHSSSFFDDNIISQGSGSTSRLKCYRKRLNKQESDREYTTLVTPVKVESHSFSNSSHRAVNLKDCQQEQSFWSLVQNPNPSSQICKTANATSGNDQPLKDRPIQKISFDDCFY